MEQRESQPAGQAGGAGGSGSGLESTARGLVAEPLVQLTRRDRRLVAELLAHDIVRIRLSTRRSRWLALESCCYLVDDLLVDSGFVHAGDLLLEYLAGREVHAIACTHNHEDHTGNSGSIARAHGCPIYLARPDRAWAEGVGRLPLYRRIWWGPPQAFAPQEMPDQIRGRRRSLIALHTPGHSQTHVVLYEQHTGVVFAGDLYISGGASAIMAHENPYETIESLRRVADLSPSLLVNGHGLALPDPAQRLRAKADRIASAAAQVRALHGQGLGPRRIAHRVFDRGWAREWMTAVMTGGEFSRLRFVRACLAHHPAPGS